MFKFLFCLAIAVVTCESQTTPPPPVRCGEIPSNIYKCIGNPKVIKPERATLIDCDKTASECERMKCIFRKSGWLDGEKVNKQKVIEHFDQFAKDHPDWSPAVQYTKTACLSGDLPPQGVYVNCAPYDVLTCALSGFIKNAQPTQWSSSAECSYPRQFAASCPTCPNDCFSPMIPSGSCNACVLLPRSP